MRVTGWAPRVAAIALVVALTGCGAARSSGSGAEGVERAKEQQSLVGEDAVAPEMIDVAELRDARVELVVGQTLVIDTGDLAVASYRAAVADETVAVFVAGHRDDSAEFAPGLTALEAGSTEVTLTNEQGGTDPVQFEVVVQPR